MNKVEGVDLSIDHPNKRLKVLECDKEIINVSDKLVELAEKEDLNKIILFGREPINETFIEQEFVAEGCIDGFYDGESAYMISKFLSEDRMKNETVQKEEQILKTLESLDAQPVQHNLSDYGIRNATISDIPKIKRVFEVVFASYPTPMYDENYIKKIMNSHVHFAVAENEDGIVSVASAEMDLERNNAEITDCATLPSHRGNGLMNHIVDFLEEEMEDKGISNLFSLARAVSFGMNKVLYNQQYQYRGRLIKNVHIAGQWENMNIWVKQLAK